MITVRDIINVCNGVLIQGNDELECKNFTKDTRTINKGDIYVGIKGEVYDGNTFYMEAFNKGASACILDNESIIQKVDKDKTIILVDDSVKAIGALAKYKRSLYNIPVVAITGSVGKTSVKDMIYSVMKMKYNVLATKGNYNNEIGVPFTILGLNKHDALVVEMGMNHFNELHYLSNIAKPTLAVITNIGTAHIGNLGSRENILKAKLEILDGMNGGTLFINNDNDMLRTVKYDNLITIGIDNESDYMAHDINMKAFSEEFYINDEYINLPVGSKAFIYNALFAYAVGIKLGISKEDIVQALESFKLSPHRLEVIHTKNYTVIDDTYNASPSSTESGLKSVNEIKGKRKIAVLSDILELGNFSKDIHLKLGEIFKDLEFDVIIAFGNDIKYLIENAKKYVNNIYYCKDSIDAEKKLREIIKENDVIYFKGSNGMKVNTIVENLKKDFMN